MAPLSESLGSGASSQMNAVLDEGLRVLSRDQQITFRRYVRLVLPLDGFVFWVRADLTARGSALFNSSALNSSPLNEGPSPEAPIEEISVRGSLHSNATSMQQEDEGYALSRVVFTTDEEVQALNSIAPGEMYIGEFEYPPRSDKSSSIGDFKVGVSSIEGSHQGRLRFAFSSQGFYYVAAGLWHYQGDAVYPALETQIIDTLAGFDSRPLVVSNSLPFWLGFSQVSPHPWVAPREIFPVYPSFSVPYNVSPPYATAHVVPEATTGIGSAPLISSKDSSTTQLTHDTVRVTTYGLRNAASIAFMAAVMRATVDFGVVGIMNVPIPRDEKRTQAELGLLAMKKTIEFEVSYYQSSINDFAVQSIKSAIPSFIF